jgi:hypothetical protein
LRFFRQGQRAKLVEVLFEVGDAWAWPVCAEQGLVGNLLQTREVFQQGLGWNSTDVQEYVRVPAHQEKCCLHPERASAVGQEDFQLGEIDGYVVDVDGIAVFVAGTGEDRCAGVKHHWNAVGLSSAIDDFQFIYSGQVIVGKQQLVRRMNFYHLDVQPQKLFDVGHDV